MSNLLKLFFLCVFFCISVSGNAFFEIVEVMPNTLDDKNLEYITLKNTSDISQSLSGYILADKSKQYVFTEDIHVLPGERKQFFRPQTKLVLNNTNEEIYLFHSLGEKIDEVIYSTSVKGEFLIFEEVSLGGENGIISQEAYISGEIFISNEVEINPPTDTSPSIPLLPGEGSGSLQVPEIIFSLQRPSYITQSGSTDIYVCDSDREECKVNFDLRNSFSGELLERDYICEIDFGFGITTGQERKCNPNTVIFPEGEHEVMFKIFHEDDVSVFSEKMITINNIRKILQPHHSSQERVVSNVGSSELNTGEADEIISKIYIHKPRIIVQSGLTGKGRYFYCEKSECKINLNYEKKHKDERCFWHFNHNSQSSKTTHTRCNPGYITVKPGTHEMFLRVYEDDNEDNRKTTRFYVYNQEKMQPLSPDLSQLWVCPSECEGAPQGEMKLQSEQITLEINLQGKISSEKSLSGSLLSCSGVEKCYVNLEGIITGERSDSEYSWLLNGEEFSQKLNPKGIWVEGEGNHEIILKVGNTQELFYVKIHPEVSFLPLEEKGMRVEEETEQGENRNTESKIPFTQNFLPLKYDGLRISGKAPSGSKIEIYSAGNKVLSGVSDEKGKYRLVSKDFIAGEYTFDTKVILDSGEEILLEQSGKYTLLHEKRSNWFISKTTKKSSSSQTQKIPTPPKLILQTSSSDGFYSSEQESLGLGERIFLVVIIIFTAIFGVLHLLFIQMKNTSKNIFTLYSLSFSTRQRVCLILG